MNHQPPREWTTLEGCNVLVVEDQYLIASEICELLERAGARVLPPARDVETALHMIRLAQPDVALLDVNLDGEQVYPVAEALQSTNIPFAFLTGYDSDCIDLRFEAHPRLEKPVRAEAVRQTVRGLRGASGGQGSALDPLGP